MKRALRQLKYDPIPTLLKRGDTSIQLFVRRDIFGERISVEDLWQLAEPRRLLRKQKSDGYWLYPSPKNQVRSTENYNQLETYRNLGVLVEQYGFTRENIAIKNAAEYLFSFQSNEGDIRGIYGNQYSPNYTAGIAELLIKVGYGLDARIEKAFEWLVSVRQDDGGWAIPFRTHKYNIDVISTDSTPVAPDKSKPFSWLVTGVVLRAFAAHPEYRKSIEARQAAKLLLSALFQKDNYRDRAAPEYWLRFTFPFWYTDLISAMDSLSILGFSEQDPQITKALEWFIAKQRANGVWSFRITKGRNKEMLELWLALAVCRIFKRFD